MVANSRIKLPYHYYYTNENDSEIKKNILLNPVLAFEEHKEAAADKQRQTPEKQISIG